MMTGELETLRAQVRSWLDENVPADLTLPQRGAEMSPELVEWTLEFRRKLGAQGWLAPAWPVYFGGGGLSPAASRVVQEELGRKTLPRLPIDQMWLTPLRLWGTEEQKGRWLPPTLRGEITVTHAISELRGGSDLAGQTTVALRNGDRYLVNGEKGYIHGPFRPDYLFLLATTDPEGPRYENLSTIILDAHDPGVSFKGGRKTLVGTGDASVAFQDVWVPADWIVGGEGSGWKVAQTMIEVERGGPGVTPEQQQEIGARERAYWEGRG